jgi:hypothetical protein
MQSCRSRSATRKSLAEGTAPKIASAPVLLVTDLLHPIDRLPVKALLNRDVSHGRSRRGPMPVLLAGREPDHITGPDFLDRSAFALKPFALCGIP